MLVSLLRLQGLTRLPGDRALLSCDKAAVDAAWPQPSLKGALLGGQDGNDGLVEHRLEPFLCES